MPYALGKNVFRSVVKNILKKIDIGVTRYSTLEKLFKDSSELNQRNSEIKLLQRLNNASAQDLLYFFEHSKSQLLQDLFVLARLGFKRNGYFVEFGATNGYDLSNTYLMEKELGWNGILAEPAKVWHKDLKSNRSCNIETDCVWKDSSSRLVFNQVAAATLSTINSYSDID